MPWHLDFVAGEAMSVTVTLDWWQVVVLVVVLVFVRPFVQGFAQAMWDDVRRGNRG